MIQIDLEMPKCCDECKFVYDSCKCIITGSRIDWDKSDSERLLDCPLNKIADPYKGMTNGEVIKAVFPDIPRTLEWHLQNVTDDDWWNSPYEPQESEEISDRNLKMWEDIYEEEKRREGEES